ncbi:MAG: hypothetical protein Q4A31_10040, partial [Corynebacterium sp.]|uniref:hypothetical protein n=1 Tax=Corynebacterium sp. TaxID=1720 RepID=UPI0026DC45A1
GFIASGGAGEQRCSLVEAVTCACELMNLGFLADPTDLLRFDVLELNTLIYNAAIVVGADRAWIPMYPGFPKQVIETSSAQLLFDQLVHYITSGALLPALRGEFERTPNATFADLKPLRLLKPSVADLAGLWGQSVGLSEQDAEFAVDLALWLEEDSLVDFEMTDFSSSENFGLACETLTSIGVQGVFDVGVTKVRNADDLLRLIVGCFGSGARLLQDVRLRSVPQAKRRVILDALARREQQFDLDLLFRRRKVWQKVMRVLHPYAQPNAPRTQLDIIHENVKFRTTNALVEQALVDGDIITACTLLSKQPGNLIRRLDHLMRLAGARRTLGWQDNVAALDAALKQAAPKVRLSTLISVLNHLRTREDTFKVVKIPGKGNVLQKVEATKVLPMVLAKVNLRIQEAITARLALVSAPEAAVACGSAVPVELVKRDTSTGLSVIKRGERIALWDDVDNERADENPGIIRMFIHWYGGDVDLGVVLADATLKNRIGFVDYTNHSEKRFRNAIVHSGDIVNAPNGGCEFIDIDVKVLRKRFPHARYAICSVISFGAGLLSKVDSFAGAMVRGSGIEGKLFEPRSVITAATPTVPSTSAIPFVVDLDTFELVWLDSSLGTRRGGYSAGRSVAFDLVRAEMSVLSKKVTEGELLSWWAKTHGVATTDEPVDDLQISALLAGC